MLKGIAVLMTCCFLTGCSGAHFSKEARLALPDVVEYSLEQHHKVMREITIEGSDPPACAVPETCEWLKDYHIMRNQTRIARGEKPKK